MVSAAGVTRQRQVRRHQEIQEVHAHPLAAGFESAARQNGRRRYTRIIRVIRFHEKA